MQGARVKPTTKVRVVVNVEVGEPTDPRIFRDLALAAIDRYLMQVGGRAAARLEEPSRAQYYVRHRTAQEGPYRHEPPLWHYYGPFDTYESAKACWDEVQPNWQEGGVVRRCGPCGQDTEAHA